MMDRRTRAIGLALLYSGVLGASIGTWLAIQLGWRPALPGAWDRQSEIAAALALMFLTLLSALGAGAMIPTERLPQSLRSIPSTAVLSVAMCLLLASQQLAPMSSASEIAVTLGKSIMGGCALGLLLGLAALLSKDRRLIEENPALGHGALLLGLGVVAIGGAILLLTHLSVIRLNHPAP